MNNFLKYTLSSSNVFIRVQNQYMQVSSSYRIPTDWSGLQSPIMPMCKDTAAILIIFNKL